MLVNDLNAIENDGSSSFTFNSETSQENESASSDSNNKRKEDRRHLIYYLKVENRVTGELIGRVVDITRSGILLISVDKFDDLSEIPVKIELGDQLFERMHGHLELNIICRWSKQDVNPSYYVNGFSFLNQTEKDETIINKLIEALGFRD